MEIDQLKSSAKEDQMEMMMMMMMMQMDKFPEFYGSCNNNDAAEFPPSDHINNIASMPYSFDNNNSPHNNIASPSFPSMPSNVSFNGIATSTTAVQETSMPPYNHLSYSASSYNSSVPSSKKPRNSMAAMRETIFRIAAMQPIHIDPESVKPPKRRNVKISKDPQSVAARHRREKISERIRVLQRLVPGGTKMDTASMLDEAIHYVKFLKTQVQSLERAAANRPTGLGFPAALTTGSYLPTGKAYDQPVQNGQDYADA